MRVYIETYGCTANEADSAGIRDAVLASGEAIASIPDEADVIVVNTCAVTGHTSNSMLRAVARFPGKRVIVAGCLAAAEPGRLTGYEFVDGPGSLPVVQALGLRPGAGLPVAMTGRTATIKIAEGCNGQCSYCIVRLVRGRLRSTPAPDVVEAACRAISAGASELFLTSQDSGAYGLDTGVRLPALVRSIASLPGDFKVRIGMMNPFSIADFLPDMVDVLNHPKVYRFAHIPVQSGSDRILQLMQRPYTEQEYSDIVLRLRTGVPGITLSTDYIVGFPTEAEADFRLTLDDLRTNRPLKVNITRFSPRPGTPAAAMPDVLERTKKERSRMLTTLHHEVTSHDLKKAVGSRRAVLVSEKGKPGTVIARDPSYNMVVIEEDLPLGTVVDVEISAAKTTYLIGRRV